MMEIARLFFYCFTILSVIVSLCLNAAFLAKTEEQINAYYNGNILLLVFSALCVLVLPILAFLGHGRRRKDVAGVTIAECIILFMFWCLFLSGASKFTSEYKWGYFPWDNYCGFFSQCSLGRSALAWAWISFASLTVLFIVALAYGMYDHENKKWKRDQQGLQPVGSNDPNAPQASENGQGEKVIAGVPPVAPPKAYTTAI